MWDSHFAKNPQAQDVNLGTCAEVEEELQIVGLSNTHTHQSRSEMKIMKRETLAQLASVNGVMAVKAVLSRRSIINALLICITSHLS